MSRGGGRRASKSTARGGRPGWLGVVHRLPVPARARCCAVHRLGRLIGADARKRGEDVAASAAGATS